jgi:hypothetical protein
MAIFNDVENVRHYVSAELARYGAGDQGGLSESLLIQGGLFCGRKFSEAGYTAVWFIEEDEIKFFAPCGELLSTDIASEGVAAFLAESQQTRRAA